MCLSSLSSPRLSKKDPRIIWAEALEARSLEMSEKRAGAFSPACAFVCAAERAVKSEAGRHVMLSAGTRAIDTLPRRERDGRALVRLRVCAGAACRPAADALGPTAVRYRRSATDRPRRRLIENEPALTMANPHQ